VNPRETLEAILGIHSTSTANIEYAPGDEGAISPSEESNLKTTQNDMAKELHDPQVRLSAFVAYCGLGVSCLSIAALMKSEKRTVEEDDITEGILDSVDVPSMLKHGIPASQGRACAALPALCKITTLRNKLLEKDLIYQIVKLCQTAGENQLIAMKTLSYLAQRFG
jgi:hypothetical protein